MPKSEARGRWMRQAAEIREEDGGLRVEGYAAVFDEEADIGGMFREVIAPGAFRSAIGRDDVVFLVNHDGLPLARTRSGTLELSEDARGLRIGATLDPEDPDVRAISGKMRRGDLDKMSFAFYATRQEWDESGEVPLRIVRDAELVDVSIVNFPAYEGTEIGLRALQAHRAETRRANFHAAQLRRRMKMTLDLKVRENG